MDVYYTRDDDWIVVAGGVATIGITDHAQARLGAILSVQLPPIGAVLRTGGEMVLIESVKAASDVFAPLGGTVTAVNDALGREPSLVNTAAEGDGWLVRLQIRDVTELAGLLRRDAYLATIRQA